MKRVVFEALGLFHLSAAVFLCTSCGGSHAYQASAKFSLHSGKILRSCLGRGLCVRVYLWLTTMRSLDDTCGGLNVTMGRATTMWIASTAIKLDSVLSLSPLCSISFCFTLMKTHSALSQRMKFCSALQWDGNQEFFSFTADPPCCQTNTTWRREPIF